MSPSRTLFLLIPVVFTVCVGPIGCQISEDLWNSISDFSISSTLGPIARAFAEQEEDFPVGNPPDPVDDTASQIKYPESLGENDNELQNSFSESNVRTRKNSHAGQDSGKVGIGEGALVKVVAELRTEVRALKSELRGVQVGLSECAAARANARRTENDHVRVQWLQREMAQTREGCWKWRTAEWV